MRAGSKSAPSSVGFGTTPSGVAGLANGGFVVTWSDLSSSFSLGVVKAQEFDASGNKVGSELVVDYPRLFPFNPSVTGLTNGGFVVTWRDMSSTLGDSSGWSIKAHVFDANGVTVGSSEFLVNTQTAGNQSNPTITGLTNGGFVVTWQDLSGTLGDNSGSSIKAQVFDASGAKVGSEFLLNTQTAGDQSNPTITALTNGGFVVTWSDLSGTLGDSSGWSIKAQVFDASGAKVGSEFLVNTETANDQSIPSVTGLTNGNFVVTWHDLSQTLGDSSSGSIKAQVFTLNSGPANPPAAAIESILSDPSNGDLGPGKNVTLTVNFSEPVTVAGGTPTLALNDGGTAFYTSGSGSSALVFTYTVGALGSGQNTSDLALAATNATNLNGATVTDAFGTAADLSGANGYNPVGTLQINTTPPTPNLVVNGEFSAGNTGFATDYLYVPRIYSETQYTITPASQINSSQAYYPNAWTAVSTDPLGGDGNVLLVNGAPAPNQLVWGEQVTVTPNTDYAFSFYAVDVNNHIESDAVLQASINGIVGVQLNTNYETWQQASFIWNSGSNTTASISLIDVNTSAGANDFALDNISLSPLNQPPVTTSVSALPSTGEFGPGSTVTLTVNFSEAVTVAGGTPTLALNDGGTAFYTSGSEFKRVGVYLHGGGARERPKHVRLGARCNQCNQPQWRDDYGCLWNGS